MRVLQIDGLKIVGHIQRAVWAHDFIASSGFGPIVPFYIREVGQKFYTTAQ